MQVIMIRQTLKLFYFVIGLITTGLGIVGIFLPVLPTTPFLLLALWAFGKSSPRLQQWLYHHPRYGKTLREWSKYGVITRRIKFIAISTMSVSVPIGYFMTQSLIVLSVHATVIVLVALFIITRPSHAPQRDIIEDS